jgi:hypothetical protein
MFIVSVTAFVLAVFPTLPGRLERGFQTIVQTLARSRADREFDRYLRHDPTPETALTLPTMTWSGVRIDWAPLNHVLFTGRDTPELRARTWERLKKYLSEHRSGIPPLVVVFWGHKESLSEFSQYVGKGVAVVWDPEGMLHREWNAFFPLRFYTVDREVEFCKQAGALPARGAGMQLYRSTLTTDLTEMSTARSSDEGGES